MNYNEIFASCIMSELRNEADLSKSGKYCKELAFSEAIKGKGLSSKEYFLAIRLSNFVYREKHHVESFGNTRESVVEYALDNFQINWLVRRWDSVIKSKDKLKNVIAVLPQSFKNIIVDIVDTQSLINHNIAEHLIKTSEEESIKIRKMLIPTTDNENKLKHFTENKLKHFTENELIEELKRREKERIATK